MHDTHPLSTGALQPAGLPVNSFPVQDLGRFNEAARRVSKPDVQALWRRLFVFGGAATITAYLTYSLYNVLFVSGILGLETVIFCSLLLLFFSLNTAWLSLSFMTALAGFLVIAFRGKRSIAGLDGLDMSKPMESKPATAARFERPVCVPVTAVLAIRGGQRLCAAVQGWGTGGVAQSAGVFCPRPSLACASKAICAALVELCLRLEIHPSKSACVYRTARDNFRNTGPQPVTRILLR